MNPIAAIKAVVESRKAYAMIPVFDPVTKKSYVLTSVVNDFKLNSDGTASFVAETIRQDMKALTETQIQTEQETSNEDA